MNNNNKIIKYTIIIYIFIVIISVFMSKHVWTVDFESAYIKMKDIQYYRKFHKKKIMSSLISNNLLDVPHEKKNKILFLTFENRTNLEYVDIHNQNIKEYCAKWDYDYLLETECTKNVYWCKMHVVLDQLNNGTNQKTYDYVCWLDSDTFIKNMEIDIGKILNKYDSDIFIGTDNNSRYDLTNAGVFLIKNSPKGKQFMKDCINYPPKFCFNKDGTLKGDWATFCYEQGAMNLLIADTYKNNTTLLPNEIIFNYYTCSNDVFIMHMYASSNANRVDCFTQQ